MTSALLSFYAQSANKLLKVFSHFVTASNYTGLFRGHNCV